MLRRFVVLGISVLAASEADALRIARGEPAKPVTKRAEPAATVQEAPPPTLRSGFAMTPRSRPIFVAVV